MGTRGMVIFERTNERCACVYTANDAYPSGLGRRLLKSLDIMGLGPVNRLACIFVADMINDGRSILLVEEDRWDARDIEWKYTVSAHAATEPDKIVVASTEPVKIVVQEGSKVVFSGDLSALREFVANWTFDS